MFAYTIFQLKMTTITLCHHRTSKLIVKITAMTLLRAHKMTQQEMHIPRQITEKLTVMVNK